MGLGTQKYRFILDLTKEQDLSFIAILETGKRNFTPPFLKNLCAGRDFIWHEKEPRGDLGEFSWG
jgi:hypothetical protein